MTSGEYRLLLEAIDAQSDFLYLTMYLLYVRDKIVETGREDIVAMLDLLIKLRCNGMHSREDVDKRSSAINSLLLLGETLPSEDLAEALKNIRLTGRRLRAAS